MKISKRYPGLAYDHINGKFYKIKSIEPLLLERELFVDSNANLSYKCNISGCLVKKKAIIIAFEALHDTQIRDKIPYFKDLNASNFRGGNIGCVKKEEYTKMKDALRNINGDVKILPHSTDAYVYRVKYRKNGKVCIKTCHDIVKALNFKRRIILLSSKTLSKYLTTI